MQEVCKFDVKANAIPNVLEKYMAFATNTWFLLTACNL